VHALGVRLGPDDSLDIAAPFGFDDVFNMVIRPNKAIDNFASHICKGGAGPGHLAGDYGHSVGPLAPRLSD